MIDHNTVEELLRQSADSLGDFRVISSTDAVCEAFFIENKPCMVIDMQAVEFAYDMFVSTSHLSGVKNDELLKTLLLKRCILRSLSCNMPEVTLSLLIEFLRSGIGYRNLDVGGDLHLIDGPIFSCAFSIVNFLVAHEFYHVQVFLDPDEHQMLKFYYPENESDEDLSDFDTAMLQFQNGLGEKIKNHPDLSQILNEELMADADAIATSIRIYGGNTITFETKKWILSCMQTAVRSVWINELINRQIECTLSGGSVSADDEYLNALAGRCSVMCDFVTVAWAQIVDLDMDENRDEDKEKWELLNLVSRDQEDFVRNTFSHLLEIFESESATSNARLAYRLINNGIVDTISLKRKIIKFLVETA